MAKPKSTKRSSDAALERLAELRESGSNPAAEAELIRYIGHTSGHVATRAIKLAAEWKMNTAVPEFEKAFDRFLANPLDSDKGCSGKVAVVEALIALEQHRPAIYWRGIRYRQMEPVWGKHEDTAPPLRAACARGLATMAHDRVHVALAELILDPERVAREGAVSALAWLATSEAELVLRMKVLVGDAEPLVLGECFRALMTHWSEDSFDLVASQLRAHNPDLVEQAALSLGESKHPDAFDKLAHAYEHSLSDVKRALLLPIALLRSDAAFDFVLDVLRNGPTGAALAAVQALAIFETDEKRAARIRDSARDRGGKIAMAHADQRRGANE